MQIVILPCFHSDHWVVKLQICSTNLQTHCHYLHNCSHLPYILPMPDEFGPNLLFMQLMDHQTQTLPPVDPSHNAWISPDNWALTNQCTTALKQLPLPVELQPLQKAICQKVCHDCAVCLKNIGDKMQTHLDANDPKEAWRLVKVWYCQQAQVLPQTQNALISISQEYWMLYMCQEPPDYPIFRLVSFEMLDTILDETKIEAALKTLVWNG